MAGALTCPGGLPRQWVGTVVLAVAVAAPVACRWPRTLGVEEPSSRAVLAVTGCDWLAAGLLVTLLGTCGAHASGVSNANNVE